MNLYLPFPPWLLINSGCRFCASGDWNTTIKKKNRVGPNLDLWLKPVGLCLGFSFPLASSGRLAWTPSLGFPAILQTHSDLGYDISLLDFSAWSSVSLLPQLPPALFSSLSLKRAFWPVPSTSVFPASGFFRKHSPPTPATPVLQGLKESCAFFEMGLERACFLLAADLSSMPSPSTLLKELLWHCGLFCTCLSSS